MLENYRYAWTRGKVRAEYENADAILRDQPLNNVSQAYQLVAQKISPSVVSVKAYFERQQGMVQTLEGGQGSGVIVSPDGYIVTNFHVIKNLIENDSARSTILVSLSDRSHANAKIVGYDIATDLAVLKVNRNRLIAAEWGNSDSLRVGSMVWAIGSPYGYENSVSAGIVSGKNRMGFQDDSPLQEFIQTDAAVNPGNSGGPLVDARGRVVGINTQILGDKFQGISFAIPGNDVQAVFEQIKENGTYRRGRLGTYLFLPNFHTPATIGFKEYSEMVEIVREGGALVTEVEPGTTAARVGIRPLDHIVSWNGVAVQHGNTCFH